MPSVAAATGTPSCAAASTAERQRLTEQPARAVRQHRADAETDSEDDELGMVGELAHLQRGARARRRTAVRRSPR